jgi:hypothetical protein
MPFQSDLFKEKVESFGIHELISDVPPEKSNDFEFCSTYIANR